MAWIRRLAGALAVTVPALAAAQSGRCLVVPPGARVEIEEEQVTEPCAPPAYPAVPRAAVPRVEPPAPATALRGRAELAAERAEWFWGVGVTLGTVFRSGRKEPYFGAGFKVAWEPLERLRFETDVALSGRPNDGLLFDWTVGASWIIADWVVAPVVGGGFGIQLQDMELAQTVDGRDSMDTCGFDLYASFGFEALRTTRTRLVADVRMNVPSFRTGYGEAERWIPSVRSTLAFLW